MIIYTKDMCLRYDETHEKKEKLYNENKSVDKRTGNINNVNKSRLLRQIARLPVSKENNVKHKMDHDKPLKCPGEPDASCILN